MAPFRRIGNFEVDLGRKLGGGGFGVVYRAMDMSQSPPEECVAKHVQFTGASPRATVDREVDMMRAANGHSAICNLLGYELEADSAWVFMELASGGELFDRLIDSGSLSERAARPFAANLIAALHHCHSRGIVHRDVKLENVMLCAEDPHAIKLIDFGLAVRVTSETQRFHDGVGSKSYKSPELFDANALARGYLAPPVDVWATGITLFSLLAGFFPFDKAQPRDWRFARFADDVARGVGACDALFAQYNRACTFSAEAKQMLDAMLQVDPLLRPTLPAIMQNAWVNATDDEAAAADEQVYRSLGAGGEEAAAPFRCPTNAMGITRQRAAVGDEAD